MKTLIFSAVLSIATSLSLSAKAIKWPEKDPSFSITLPDDWSCKPKDEGTLLCEAEQEYGLEFRLMTTKLHGEEQIKALLRNVMQESAKHDEAKNVKIGAVQETTTSANVKLLRLNMTASKEGTGILWWSAAFKTNDGPYNVLFATIAQDNKAHEKKIARIADTIAPLVTGESAKPKQGEFARTIKWPEKNPSFKITVFDDWACQQEDDGGTLICEAKKDSGLTFRIAPTKLHGEEQMKVLLSKVAQQSVTRVEAKDVKIGAVQEATNSADVKLLRLNATATKEGTGILWWYAAFKTNDGPHNLLFATIAQDNKAHERKIARIADTIAPLVAEEGAKRKGDFDPYKGSVTTLLPAEFSNTELSSLGIKFKQTSTSDRTSSWKRQRASEAVRFSYNMGSIIIVKIEGELVNFETSSHAVAALKAMAAEKGGTIAPKGDGQRFSAQNGQIIGWTNGSLMCVVIGGTDPAAGNFEKAAPF